ncbi:hypothetical protein ACP4OV_031021 [Aristida adscensionis]
MVTAASDMATSPLDQLHALMRNMYATGLLDEQFKKMQMLQDAMEPDFVVETVTLFCDDGVQIMGQLAELLEKPTVNFYELDMLIHKLKGSSTGCGSPKIEEHLHSVTRVLPANEYRRECKKKLESVKIEFYEVREWFQIMLQLLRQIKGLFPK